MAYGRNVGFEVIQVEADIALLANLDLTVTMDGSEDSSYTNPLVTNKPIFAVPLMVAGIGFTASIHASLTSIFNLQGSGNMLVTAGEPFHINSPGDDCQKFCMISTVHAAVCIVLWTHRLDKTTASKLGVYFAS